MAQPSTAMSCVATAVMRRKKMSERLRMSAASTMASTRKLSAQSSRPMTVCMGRIQLLRRPTALLYRLSTSGDQHSLSE